MTVECYDALADEYAQRAEKSRISIRATVNQHFVPLLPRYAKVLDIGCAVGVATEELCAAGCDAAGVDNSRRMIAIARRDRQQGHFMCADYIDTPFWNLDGILAFAFVHLFPKSEAPLLLGKMYWELKSGGILYTGTTVEPESSEGWESKDDYPGAPKRYRARYTKNEYAELVASVGFEPVSITEHTDEFGKLWRDVLVRRPA